MKDSPLGTANSGKVSTSSSFDVPVGRTGAAIELTSVAVVYVGLITLAIRFTAEPTLREAISALPAPAARVLNRFFGFR